MNVTKVAHELQGDATSQPGEAKKGTGATVVLPALQSKLGPQQKDSRQSKLWDLDMKVQGSQKATQQVVWWVPSGVQGQGHMYR